MAKDYRHRPRVMGKGYSKSWNWRRLRDTCIEELGVDVKDMADRAASTLKLTEGRYA
jgi:hypothetical protein